MTCDRLYGQVYCTAAMTAETAASDSRGICIYNWYAELFHLQLATPVAA